MYELTPEDQKRISGAWYWLFQETAQLDYDKRKPNGYHWFWGIFFLKHQLVNFDIKEMQIALPDRRWIKDINDSLSNEETVEEHRALVYPVAADFFERLGKPDMIRIIDFSNLSFNKPIDFSNFIFPIDADFRNTQFLDNVFFEKAVFCETVNFEKAEFHKQPKTYKETAKFKDAIFMKTADFSKTIFGAYANFKGATFSGRTIFQQAEFKYHAPRFYETTFNNEIILNRIELPPAKREKLHPIKRDKHNKNDTKNDILQKTVEENKSAYETLIHLMEKQNKYHDQHRFFREEMRWRQVGNILTRERRRIESQNWRATRPQNYYWCTVKLLECSMACLLNCLLNIVRLIRRRKPKARQQNTDNAGNYLTKRYSLLLWLEDNFIIAFFCLYEKIADYGYGIGRAFGWWLGHILVGGAILFGLRLIFCFKGFWNDLGCSFGISLSNSHAFFFNGERLQDCYDTFKYLPAFNLIWATQTIFGTLLIFLLALTLRVRFRLK